MNDWADGSSILGAKRCRPAPGDRHARKDHQHHQPAEKFELSRTHGHWLGHGVLLGSSNRVAKPAIGFPLQIRDIPSRHAPRLGTTANPFAFCMDACHFARHA